MAPTSKKKITETALAEATFATRLLHGDHKFAGNGAVAPDISVSTTFKQREFPGDLPPEFKDVDSLNPECHVYSRYTQPVFTRVEKVLGNICGGYATTYRSGLSAAFAALIYYKPKRVAFRDGYFGVREVISTYQKVNPDFKVIDIDEPYVQGDLVWIETPVNPTGEVKDIQYFADKAHATSAHLVIDATFAPPPLQDPFKFGADMVMHSASKYFGGHSDLLGGVLVVKSEEAAVQLWKERVFLGSVMGSLEAFLLLRSLRTLELRVLKQSRTAAQLAQWLDRLARVPVGTEWDRVPGGIVTKVWHGSFQRHDVFVEKQMTGGHSPTFSILVKDGKAARALALSLAFVTSATSLGGVESLIEQRHVMDRRADPKLLRISVGLEDIEDLKADFRDAFRRVLKGESKL
ncbi:cystathionine gamma-synthase [Cantharellus anzutake]|uniref:cystathionine gamma-synthase n=1 Tax=Cantharellus anzutake TaxID=1750568 RepID=UPI0019075E74|nr:cystathionine gamma-synthase [Cantharellus anzutake]KAF8341267.1 cystathionine gamma-synthase [Cantharellus anzutake]